MTKDGMRSLLEDHLIALLKEDKKNHSGEEMKDITTAICETVKTILKLDNNYIN